mgnify:CR=1 FL=1
MSDQLTQNSLNQLEKNIQNLLGKYQSGQDELEAIKEENTSLKTEIQELKSRLSNFQNQDKIAKIVSNTTVEKEESTELKHKLNEYIKEIDRCIEYLS